MDTLHLVPFEAAEIHRIEEYDASKFCIKELRIKDLHKNLCKKPYFPVKLVRPLERHQEEQRTCRLSTKNNEAEYVYEDSEDEHEDSEDEQVALLPLSARFPNPYEPRRKFPAAEKQPSQQRSAKRKSRLPSELSDVKSHSETPKEVQGYPRRSTAKLKAKHFRLPAKSPEVEHRRSRKHFFDVPLRSSKKDPKLSSNTSESMEGSSAAEASERRSKTPKSSGKRDSKISDPSRERTLPLDKKSKTSDIKLKQKQSPVKSKPAASRQVRAPHIRKLRSGYSSENGATSDGERNVRNLGANFPSFVVKMKHSNVIACFWLGIPAEFDPKQHLPDEDVFIELQDDKGLKWETNYLPRKKGLSGGWRRFVFDHGLELGDICVFELVKPLKFLVHITRAVEGGKAVLARVSKVPARRTPSSAPATTKKSSSLHSALFSSRKRRNTDFSHGKSPNKFPSKKRHLAVDHELQQEGSEGADPVSVPTTPPTKNKPLFYSEGAKTKRDRSDVKKKAATKKNRDESERYENGYAPSSSEESRGGEEEPEKTPKETSPSKQKRLSDVSDDDASGGGIHAKRSQEREETVARKSAFASSTEEQSDGPLSSKAATPPSRKKPKRVLQIYSSDEEEKSNSGLKADSGQEEGSQSDVSKDVDIETVPLSVDLFRGKSDVSEERVTTLGEKSFKGTGEKSRNGNGNGSVSARPIPKESKSVSTSHNSEWNSVYDVVKAISAAEGIGNGDDAAVDEEEPLSPKRPSSSKPAKAKQEKEGRRKLPESADFQQALSSADDKHKWVFAEASSKPKTDERKVETTPVRGKAVKQKPIRRRPSVYYETDEDEDEYPVQSPPISARKGGKKSSVSRISKEDTEVKGKHRKSLPVLKNGISKEGTEVKVKPRKSLPVLKNGTKRSKAGSFELKTRPVDKPEKSSPGKKGGSTKTKRKEKIEVRCLTSSDSEVEVEISSDSHDTSQSGPKKTPVGKVQDPSSSDGPCSPDSSDAISDDYPVITRVSPKPFSRELKQYRTPPMSKKRPQESVIHSKSRGRFRSV